jgi:hypothetical protein
MSKEQEWIDGNNIVSDTIPDARIKQEGEASRLAVVLAWIVALCIVVAMVMGTIKLGLVLFT